jgi:hypothetical protein
MTKLSPFIATVAGAAVLALAASAQAFAGHGGGHHHGSPALAACMAATPKSEKSTLWSTFKGSSLHADEQAVHLAKQKLAQQILAKNTSLTDYETALSQAQLKVIQDQDGIAQTVCGQLKPAQLAAANTLYTNLQGNREAVHSYFAAARVAAGDTSDQGADQPADQ